LLTLWVHIRLNVISLSGGSHERSRLPPGNHFAVHVNQFRSLANSYLDSCCRVRFSTPARPERGAQSVPATKPPAEPFVPPPPYWTYHNPDQCWYGTESLWTLVGIRGVWNVHSNVLENEGVYRTKLTYWRRGFDSRKDRPDLVVDARSLDRSAPLLHALPAPAVFVTGPVPSAMRASDRFIWIFLAL
jgi:hypothetical protein